VLDRIEPSSNHFASLSILHIFSPLSFLPSSELAIHADLRVGQHIGEQYTFHQRLIDAKYAPTLTVDMQLLTCIQAVSNLYVSVSRCHVVETDDPYAHRGQQSYSTSRLRQPIACTSAPTFAFC